MMPGHGHTVTLPSSSPSSSSSSPPYPFLSGTQAISLSTGTQHHTPMLLYKYYLKTTTHHSLSGCLWCCAPLSNISISPPPPRDTSEGVGSVTCRHSTEYRTHCTTPHRTLLKRSTPPLPLPPPSPSLARSRGPVEVVVGLVQELPLG